MANFFSRFIKDESGATAIEYGLIASLISVAAIVAFTTVGSKLSATFGYRRRPAQYLSSDNGDKAETIFRPCAGSARISRRSLIVMKRQQGCVADREFRRRRPCLSFERKVFAAGLKRLGQPVGHDHAANSRSGYGFKAAHPASAATPGSALPSSHSRNAPPAVET